MTETGADPRILREDDLVLRPWRDDDAEHVLAAFGELSIRQYAAGVVDTKADADAFVRRRVTAWDDGSGMSWAITAASTGTVLGHVGLHMTFADIGQAMVGYWLLPRARGRGVITRAVGLTSTYAFVEKGLHRIELYHAVENTASCRVAERSGFQYEGTLRQAMRYPVDDRWSDEHLHARLSSD